MTTVAQLWRGNLNPLHHFGNNNPDMKQLGERLCRYRDALEKSLDETAKELFEKYSDCLEEYLLVAYEQAFCDGFYLATKITAEALIEAEHQFTAIPTDRP